MSKQKPRGYWQDWKNAEPELRELVRRNRGKIPTYEKLLEMGRSDLAHAIGRHYGGMNEVRKRLGMDGLSKLKNDSLKDAEIVEQKIREVIDSHPDLHGKFPSAWWLQQNGYASLYTGIRKYHGGFRKFRASLGEKQASLENGMWRDLDYVFIHMRKIMNCHGFEDVPGQWTLRKLGYSSVCYAIQKYHGGFLAFRVKLNEHLGRDSENQLLLNLS